MSSGGGGEEGATIWRLVALIAIGLLVLMSILPVWPVASAPSTPAIVATPIDSSRLVIDGDPIDWLVLPGPQRRSLYVVGSRGLYRSDDGGMTWRAVGPRPPAPRVAVAASDSLLLAGSRVACARAAAPHRPLYRSGDGGATWQPVDGVTDLLPLAIWLDPRVAIGTTCAGLQLSRDEGLTWLPVSAIPADYEISASAPASEHQDSPALFVIGTSEGGTSALSVLTLTAQGEVAAGLPLVTFWGGGAVGGSRERIVLGTANGVLVSRDGGQSWRRSRAGLEDVTLSVDPTRGPIPEDELRRGFGITAVAEDPDHPDRLYVGTVAGVYQSNDDGSTWSHLTGTAGIVTALITTPRGTLLIQTDVGVLEYVVSASFATPVSNRESLSTPLSLFIKLQVPGALIERPAAQGKGGLDVEGFVRLHRVHHRSQGIPGRSRSASKCDCRTVSSGRDRLTVERFCSRIEIVVPSRRICREGLR